jgi:hypothetical protein
VGWIHYVVSTLGWYRLRVKAFLVARRIHKNHKNFGAVKKFETQQETFWVVQD